MIAPQVGPPETPNFACLGRYDAVLVRVAALAERYFPDDPVTALIKLRQFGEMLAQQVAARAGVFMSRDEPQAELLRRLKTEASYPREVLDLFHDLRRLGNDAVHEHRGDHATALSALKVARSLGIWFHKTFGDRGFKAGPFQPPVPPADPTPALLAEIDRLRAARDADLSAVDAARRRAEEAEARATSEAADRAFWERYAADTEAAQAELAARLTTLQAAAAALPAGQQAATVSAAEEAAQSIDLDEGATRAIIDVRLRALGWEADTQALRHSTGARPAKGRDMAIVEWPTASGPADYAFFVGITCVGVVEAKPKRLECLAAGPWPADSVKAGMARSSTPLARPLPELIATSLDVHMDGGCGAIRPLATRCPTRPPTSEHRLEWC